MAAHNARHARMHVPVTWLSERTDFLDYSLWCADYKYRSAISRSAANFTFRRYGQTCDETQVTDTDNQRIETRTRWHFSCELRRATTLDMHTLQIWIIRGCKFVTSAHLCTPPRIRLRSSRTNLRPPYRVSAVAYTGQIHAINAEFSTPSASRLDTVSAWMYSVDVSVSAPSAPQNALTHRSRRCSQPCFVETNHRYTGNEQQLIMMRNQYAQLTE